ncbi:MAG TPA: Lpg1974 family pore-forming outer membrane protein [Rhizomicrobium sp.]|nr:Lpg1974 family pore-forming outer membrane protein [Rhizomicrobium sp.]
MSELIDNKKTQSRLQFLATASAIALLGYTAGAAAQNDEPQLWIELGGQLTRLDVGQETFSPAFPQTRPAMFAPSTDYEELPHQSVDETGKLSFRPKGSSWSFSGGVRYGRSVRKVDANQQTFPKPVYATVVSGTLEIPFLYHGPIAHKFASTQMDARESHLIVDFQAGKDVGLGLFGGSSQIDIGLRFAQFENKSNIALASNPDWHVRYKYATPFLISIFPAAAGVKFWGGEGYHNHYATLQSERDFRGIGPSLSWNGSSPFVGNREDGELTFDYGANVAVLFGRQRAKTSHQTRSNYHPETMHYGQRGQHVSSKTFATHHTRSSNVVVPNVGAMAGVTYRIQNFKISAGYRADFFFNAMDGGNDERRSEKIGNYGPFATISFGLGG